MGRIRKPSPALVVACIALVFAMSTSAVAARYITSKDIRNNSITHADIRNGTIREADFSDSLVSTLSAEYGRPGPPGPAGPAGTPGPPGPTGPSAVSDLVRVASTRIVAPQDIDYAEAVCPPGWHVVSGGYTSVSAYGVVFASDTFGDQDSWTAMLDNMSSEYTNGEVTAVAYCTEVGKSVTPRAASGPPPQALVDKLIVARRAAHR